LGSARLNEAELPDTGSAAAMSSRVVIISVPLFRIARVTLSPPVLDALRAKGDIVIVAPFADEPEFVHSFGGPGIRFVTWRPPTLKRYERALFAVSEIMRVQGYWRRFRKRGTEYYVRNQVRNLGDNGADTRFSFGRALMFRVISAAGRSARAWRLVDRLMGTRWARLPELVEVARGYGRATLIQSANWGMQDRALATLSRQEGWRSVLVPYTTDQLDVNGYLLNGFDAVCAQGPFERERALHVHGVAPERVRCLGSVWFRHLRYLRDRVGQQHFVSDHAVVMYAGVSSLYFPRASELEAVDALAGFLRSSYPGHRLVYRPVEFDADRRSKIERRYVGHELVSVQWPAASEVGLSEYSAVEQEAALETYVRSLAGCRILVMSTVTSLCIDAALLEKAGIIASFIDRSDMLRNRHTHLFRASWYPDLRIVRSIPELLAAVDFLLSHPEQASAEATELVGRWDYPDTRFQATLKEAVYGS
jgi:hypothetical protein